MEHGDAASNIADTNAYILLQKKHSIHITRLFKYMT